MRIISGQLKGREIKAPKHKQLRPTSGKIRESFFNICQNDILGSRFLDVCSGTGAMGLEAISRGASNSVFIDHDRDTVRLLRENIKRMQVEDKGKVYEGNALKILALLDKNEQSFDLIYVDPPYDTGLGLRILAFIDQATHILAQGGSLFLEEGANTVIDHEKWHTLECHKSRKMGKTALHHFTKE